MLAQELEQTLHRALAEANSRRHGQATLEHLLLALCQDRDAQAVLRACGVDLDRLGRELTGHLDHQLSHLEVGGLANAKPTAGFQRVLQRAAIHVQSAGRDEISDTNLLVALFSERESYAVDRETMDPAAACLVAMTGAAMASLSEAFADAERSRPQR